MKLIRLADKSDAGWSVVDENLTDDLAKDSDDEKRIRSTQSRAVAKNKKKNASSRQKPYSKSETAKYSPQNYLFHGYHG